MAQARLKDTEETSRSQFDFLQYVYLLLIFYYILIGNGFFWRAEMCRYLSDITAGVHQLMWKEWSHTRLKFNHTLF